MSRKKSSQVCPRTPYLELMRAPTNMDRYTFTDYIPYACAPSVICRFTVVSLVCCGGKGPDRTASDWHFDYVSKKIYTLTFPGNHLPSRQFT